MGAFLFRWTPFFWSAFFLPLAVVFMVPILAVSDRTGTWLFALSMGLMVLHMVQSCVFPLRRWWFWLGELFAIVPWYYAIVFWLHGTWFRPELGRIGPAFIAAKTLMDVLDTFYYWVFGVMALRFAVFAVRQERRRAGTDIERE